MRNALKNIDSLLKNMANISVKGDVQTAVSGIAGFLLLITAAGWLHTALERSLLSGSS